MSQRYRDMYCGKITESEIGKELTLSGWIANIRDHGGVIFVDLRDETGIIQLVSNDDEMFLHLKKESVITVKGKIRKRSADDYNDHIATGTIELLVDCVQLLSIAPNELPFEIITSNNVSEDLRLKYRYLDLRNEKVRNNINLRAKVLHFLRNTMTDLDFLEVQTPIITASSPEGARDFIIPSRKHPGKFYALPQAPQVFKELLMVGGVDKYFQIAPCFRDEDTRRDRTLEFYQLDLEMAFVEESDIHALGEKIFYETFNHFSRKKISPLPFKKISYKEAMLKYGTDKPDLRNPLEIVDLSEYFTDTDFKPFQNSNVRGIKVANIGDKPNSWFNEIVDYANSIGMPGIGYITLVSDHEFKGPIDKFLTDSDRNKLIDAVNLKINDVLFFIANKKEKLVNKYAGLIRTKLANQLDLIDQNKYEFCIIYDFPMFEWNDEADKYEFCHNPFSLPKNGIDDYSNSKPDDILAYQYDFVCNGNEMASGAIRNTDLPSLTKGFELVGYKPEEVETRFKSLYQAFKYGVPPHGGMALGIDRIIMLLQDEDNLREVQAFPISANGEDQLMGCPSVLTEKQLREVHIKVQ